MERFLQLTALALVGVILAVVVGRNSRQMAAVLTLAVCCGLALGAMELLTPVTDLLARVRKLGGLDSELVKVLLKAAGAGLVGEMAALICADAGEHAMAKALELLTNTAVLWLSVPLIERLIDLVEEVLGAV